MSSHTHRPLHQESLVDWDAAIKNLSCRRKCIYYFFVLLQYFLYLIVFLATIVHTVLFWYRRAADAAGTTPWRLFLWAVLLTAAGVLLSDYVSATRGLADESTPDD